MKRSPIRRKRPRSVPAEVREALNERSQGQCEVLDFAGYRCAQPADHAHHKLRRSQGGEDTLENLVAACFVCHDTIHRFPAESYARGYLIRSTKREET